jgi:hypothetical protein
MAEVQKPVELPKEEAPAPVEVAPIVEPVAAETKADETPAAAETAATEEAKPEETAEAAAPAEEKKEEEVKPVESGHLGHKAQGLSFPKYVYIGELPSSAPSGSFQTRPLIVSQEPRQHQGVLLLRHRRRRAQGSHQLPEEREVR